MQGSSILLRGSACCLTGCRLSTPRLFAVRSATLPRRYRDAETSRNAEPVCELLRAAGPRAPSTSLPRWPRREHGCGGGPHLGRADPVAGDVDDVVDAPAAQKMEAPRDVLLGALRKSPQSARLRNLSLCDLIPRGTARAFRCRRRACAHQPCTALPAWTPFAWRPAREARAPHTMRSATLPSLHGPARSGGRRNLRTGGLPHMVAARRREWCLTQDFEGWTLGSSMHCERSHRL